MTADVIAGHSISRSKLIELQGTDTSLARYFDLVKSPDAVEKSPAPYAVEKRIGEVNYLVLTHDRIG